MQNELESGARLLRRGVFQHRLVFLWLAADAPAVIVDAMVQPKNVMFPTGAELLNRARENLLRIAHSSSAPTGSSRSCGPIWAA